MEPKYVITKAVVGIKLYPYQRRLAWGYRRQEADVHCLRCTDGSRR